MNSKIVQREEVYYDFSPSDPDEEIKKVVSVCFSIVVEVKGSAPSYEQAMENALFSAEKAKSALEALK